MLPGVFITLNPALYHQSYFFRDASCDYRLTPYFMAIPGGLKDPITRFGGSGESVQSVFYGALSLPSPLKLTSLVGCEANALVSDRWGVSLKTTHVQGNHKISNHLILLINIYLV